MNRLHPLSAVSRVVRYGVNGASIPLFFALFGSTVLSDVLKMDLGNAGIVSAIALVPLGFLVGALFGYLSYTRFGYELTENTLDVASGVIRRTEREIPIRRIQNVDVQQNVLHQLFAVAVVRIETAGGGGTEAVLSVVSEGEAERLQAEIRERREGGSRTADEPSREETGAEAATPTEGVAPEGPVTAESGTDQGPREPPAENGATPDRPAPSTTEPAREREPAESTLFSLSPVDLLVLAAARFRLGSIVFVVFAIPFAEEFTVSLLLRLARPFGGPTSADLTAMTPDQALVLTAISAPLAVLASYLVGAAVSVQEYYGFELARRGDDLVYERGLFQRYSGSIPTDKIQTVTLTETWLMRPLSYAALQVETAGYAGRGNGGNQSAVPIARRARVLELATELVDADVTDLSFERPPKRARRRYGVRYALVVTAVFALWVTAAMAIPGFTFWYLPAVLYLVVPVAAHLKWANRGYHLGEDHVLVRTGFWQRRTEVVPYYRLQTVVSEATVFQRRLSLATLVADTASSATLTGRAPTAYDLDAATVDELQMALRERLQAHLHG
ncbi:PH domain-containing protein [Haloarchaeobius sp. TZWWS8]|uniref:PH domain-containing protein n=1 Tax=Haloarchaeobius sp. TZWWS8 TaxID=3446121 RepID=UPI003EBC9D26